MTFTRKKIVFNFSSSSETTDFFDMHFEDIHFSVLSFF
jgi:hypothetical protein